MRQRRVTSGSPLRIQADTWNQILSLLDEAAEEGEAIRVQAAQWGHRDPDILWAVYTEPGQTILANQFAPVLITRGSGTDCQTLPTDDEGSFLTRPVFVARPLAAINSYPQHTLGILLDLGRDGQVVRVAVSGAMPTQIHTSGATSVAAVNVTSAGLVSTENFGQHKVLWWDVAKANDPRWAIVLLNAVGGIPASQVLMLVTTTATATSNFGPYGARLVARNPNSGVLTYLSDEVCLLAFGSPDVLLPRPFTVGQYVYGEYAGINTLYQAYSGKPVYYTAVEYNTIAGPTVAGVVSTGAQGFGGRKHFLDGLMTTAFTFDSTEGNTDFVFKYNLATMDTFYAEKRIAGVWHAIGDQNANYPILFGRINRHPNISEGYLTGFVFVAGSNEYASIPGVIYCHGATPTTADIPSNHAPTYLSAAKLVARYSTIATNDQIVDGGTGTTLGLTFVNGLYVGGEGSFPASLDGGTF